VVRRQRLRRARVRVSEDGGVYVFLREMFSPAVAFLWGWAMFWSMHTGIIAAIAMVFGRYLATIIPMGDAGIRLTAMGGVAVLTAINCLGVKPGSGVQTALTIAKVGAIAGLLVLLLATGTVRVPEASAASHADAFLRALVAGLFAFGGWHMVSYAAEETRDPERTIPRALMIGTAVVVAIYLALNAAYRLVLPLDRVLSSTRIAYDATLATAGPGASSAIALLVIVSSLGAVSGIILAGPRVYLAMADDGLLFRWLGAVHERFRTPYRALLVQGAWACVLVWTGSYSAIVSRVVYTEWIFFGALALGVMRLRRSAAYRPCVPGGWLSGRAARLRVDLPGDRRQSGRPRPARQPHRPRAGGRRPSGLFLVGARSCPEPSGLGVGLEKGTTTCA
jgi:APA family basic amino acid/polyamine antiporter